MERGRWKGEDGKGKMEHGRTPFSILHSPFSVLHLPSSILLLVILTWLLGGSAVLAQVTANLHMSVSPGGGEVAAVQSGTAKVYAVLSYQEAADTELKVRVFGAGGVVVFEQSAHYDGSGEKNIGITGRDILDGYVSAAQKQSDDLEVAVNLAQQSSSASAKRVRTFPAVTAVQTLDRVLAALERYPLSLTTLDKLDTAQELAAQVETQGLKITSSQVPDDELDSALDELVTLAAETVSAVDLAVDGIDTDAEWAWIDGTYTTTLELNGQIADGFDWKVSPEGTPGTPAASPTVTTEPTATLTPTQTPEHTATLTKELTATPTERRVTATTRPTSTPQPSGGRQATPTATPLRQAQATPETSPTALPPTATSVGELEPTPEIGPPTQVVSPVADDQTGYPEPEAAGSGATPVVQAVSRNESQPEAEIGDQVPGSRALEVAEVSRETPLAPQEVSALPVVRIAAIVSAVLLGLVALWLRADI